MPNMTLSQEGLYEIIESEAIVLSPYKDSVGVLTIGIGHTKMAGAPDPASLLNKSLSLRDALDLFRRDVAKYEARVNKAFTAPLQQHEFDAAVSFDFNTGAIHKATWVKLFNAGKRAEAVKAIMNWSKPAEIIPRRKREQELFAKGIYHNKEGHATLYPATPSGKVVWSKATLVKLAEEVAATPEAPDPKVLKKELKEAGSVTMSATDIQKNVAIVGTIATGVLSLVNTFTSILKAIPPFGWAAIVVVGLVVVWYLANRIQRVRINDAIAGRNIGLVVPSLTPTEEYEVVPLPKEAPSSVNEDENMEQ